MNKEDGGPAFPAPDAAKARFGDSNPDAFLGMSLRDYLAAKAMQGWTANPLPNDSSVQEVAEWAYRQADAMLAARSA